MNYYIPIDITNTAYLRKEYLVHLFGSNSDYMR